LVSIAAIRGGILKVPITVHLDGDTERFARKIHLGRSAAETKRELAIQREQISSPRARLQRAIEAELGLRACELFGRRSVRLGARRFGGRGVFRFSGERLFGGGARCCALRACARGGSAIAKEVR